MNDIVALLHNPTKILYVYLAIWALSALGHTMPAPDGKSGKLYQWFFNLLQFLLANLSRLRGITEKTVGPMPELLDPAKLPLPGEPSIPHKD